MTDDPLATVAAVMDEVGVAYAVIGAHAVNAWIEPRFTADIDVTVQAEPSELETLRQRLATRGLTVTREHGAGSSGPDFICFASETSGLRLEIQTVKTDFQRTMVARAIAEDGVRVATPEDLIVLKLIADRAKDQIDLLGLGALPDLDWEYVERWVDAWGVTDRLARLRQHLSS